MCGNSGSGAVTDICHDEPANMHVGNILSCGQRNTVPISPETMSTLAILYMQVKVEATTDLTVRVFRRDSCDEYWLHEWLFSMK